MNEEILDKDRGLALPRRHKKKGTAASRRRNPALVKQYKDSHPNCEINNCQTRGWSGPHHICFRSQGGKDEKDNLIRLCNHHHDCCHGAHADVWRRICEGVKKGFG